ncbi:MAG: hypothetical protein GTN78_03655 [Gemmatimonadales bacterium]|nr:hypothetical protein [Gemmatimonadales bacterium]NIQ99281.1 hypothetical protein [Gemmatimonadales bacterium]
MRYLRFMLVPLVFVGVSCQDRTPVEPELLDQLSLKVARPDIANSQRTPLQDGIAHYTFDLTVGPNQFDVVRLHRVVKERGPGQPSRTVDPVVLFPGAVNSFEMIFLEPSVSSVPPWDQSVAVFLAQHDIDVWGIDYAWGLVPSETSDFGFMQGWGLQKDVEHADQALAAARSIRVSTGQGNGRLHVLGFSYGAAVAYGLAGAETLLPPGLRDVKGIIPVDYDVKFREQARRDQACADAAALQADIDAGIYHDALGTKLHVIGGLAATAPDDVSPFYPPLTNWQFALFVGAAGTWHYVAGYWAGAVPTGLRFTDPYLWVDLIQAVPPYWPLQARLDLRILQCDEVDLPLDEHLTDITAPILYVGAAGGGGPDHYTASLAASNDFEQVFVQLLTDGERAFDFGHADLFTATDAASLVWQPILDWLLAHRENRTYPTVTDG